MKQEPDPTPAPVRRRSRYLSALIGGVAFGLVGGVCGFLLGLLYMRLWVCRHAASAPPPGPEMTCGLGPLLMACIGLVVLGLVAAIVGTILGYRRPMVDGTTKPPR